MNHAAALAMGLLVAAASVACFAETTLTGSVRAVDGTPIAHAFLAGLDASFVVTGYTISDSTGTFELKRSGAAEYLAVQPPARRVADSVEVSGYQPRTYVLKGATRAELRLPPAGCLILRGYSPDGRLMRWKDYEAQGLAAGQFAYATNLNDEMLPAVVWPVHDQASREENSPREKGLPALYLEPGQTAAVQMLFWPVPGYGKLWLRADDAGEGFRVPRAGEGIILDLNFELARTAVADLARRFANVSDVADLKDALRRIGEPADAAARAAAADGLLAKALRLRDDLEYRYARERIPEIRQGTLEITVRDASGKAVAGAAVEVTQASRDFGFGVFEGSPYNAKAFTLAREAGFAMGTVLLGWNWTKPVSGNWAPIDDIFGISKLEDLGYSVKAHGAIWLQQYDIMPDEALKMPHRELRDAALGHYRQLLEHYGETVDVWEVMNEPATTNVVGMPREMVFQLIRDASAAVREADPNAMTLVNNPHELSFGSKYLFYGINNEPHNDYPLTYFSFVRQAAAEGVLEDVDAVGLQFYPGHHLSEMFAGQEGPAVAPSWLIDAVTRYAQVARKPVHITEFSVPSSYAAGWNAGYWREPWNEEVQAEYADYVYTMMFAHPDVKSITWWDIMGTKPSVVTGGLTDSDGKKKRVFSTLEQRLAEWTSDVTITTDADGKVSSRCFAGAYVVTVSLPDGTVITQTVHVPERETAQLEVFAGGAAP